MVEVEMRDQNGVDAFRIDPGGSKICVQRAGLRRHMHVLPAGAGVDEHQLLASVDDEGGERCRDLAWRLKRIRQRLLDVGERRVAHKLFVDLPKPCAVVDGGDLKIADLVAVVGGRLFAARHCGGDGC